MDKETVEQWISKNYVVFEYKDKYRHGVVKAIANGGLDTVFETSNEEIESIVSASWTVFYFDHRRLFEHSDVYGCLPDSNPTQIELLAMFVKGEGNCKLLEVHQETDEGKESYSECKIH